MNKSTKLTVNADEVIKMAKLSRLEVERDKAEAFAGQISEILKDFTCVETVDVAGVKPLVTPLEEEIRKREDVVEEFAASDKAISQAPDLQGKLYRVPPVV